MADSPPETQATVRGKPRMQVLYNYPCGLVQYGTYLGIHKANPKLPATPPPPNDPVDNEFMPIENWLFAPAGSSGPGPFEKNLTELKSIGVTHVRLFLMCNAFNWGTIVDGKLEAPPYLHPRFMVHFREVLRICKLTGIKLIPSLIDFGICEPKLGDDRRTDIVKDFDMQQKFYNQVFTPMLDESIINGNDQVIFAWEIMNEPLWLSRRFYPWAQEVSVKLAVPVLGRVLFSGKVTKPFQLNLDTVDPVTVDAFLQEGITRVAKHSAKLQKATGDTTRVLHSTVGHRFFSELLTRPTGTRPQFHFYPSAAATATGFGDASVLLTGPLDPSGKPHIRKDGRPLAEPFIGELGSSEEQSDPWSELSGRDVPGPRERVRARLFGAERKGFTLAGIWPNRMQVDAVPGNRDPLKLTADGFDGIKDYIKNLPEPPQGA